MAASGCEGKFIQAFCAVFHSSKVHVHKTLAVISHVFPSSSSSSSRETELLLCHVLIDLVSTAR